jgi:hypothetical protein
VSYRLSQKSLNSGLRFAGQNSKYGFNVLAAPCGTGKVYMAALNDRLTTRYRIAIF